MAAKCEQNKWFCSKEYSEGIVKAGKYFGELKSKYSKTKYFQQIIAECTYFETYLNNQKKN
jgi:hypothetical protein